MSIEVTVQVQVLLSDADRYTVPWEGHTTTTGEVREIHFRIGSATAVQYVYRRYQNGTTTANPRPEIVRMHDLPNHVLAAIEAATRRETLR